MADPVALRVAYQDGRLNSGGGGLGAIPIIDFRVYTDQQFDIHDRYRSFVARARLTAANGSADNQVILTFPPESSRQMYVPMNFLNLMIQWLDNSARDRSGDGAARKVARANHPELVDACWTPDGEKLVEPQTYDGPGRCNQLYPNHANPRIAAGAPLADDILKCTLKPVDPRDYVHTLTEGQLVSLRAIFPQGVCDFSRPGVGRELVRGTWRKY